MQTLKTPDDWLKESKYSDITIMDPDGWDRRNFEEDWSREISEEEFSSRLMNCTVRIARQKTVVD